MSTYSRTGPSIKCLSVQNIIEALDNGSEIITSYQEILRHFINNVQISGFGKTTKHQEDIEIVQNCLDELKNTIYDNMKHFHLVLCHFDYNHYKQIRENVSIPISYKGNNQIEDAFRDIQKLLAQYEMVLQELNANTKHLNIDINKRYGNIRFIQRALSNLKDNMRPSTIQMLTYEITFYMQCWTSKSLLHSEFFGIFFESKTCKHYLEKLQNNNLSILQTNFKPIKKDGEEDENIRMQNRFGNHYPMLTTNIINYFNKKNIITRQEYIVDDIEETLKTKVFRPHRNNQYSILAEWPLAEKWHLNKKT